MFTDTTCDSLLRADHPYRKIINLLDINTNGTLQGEFVKPDDSLLDTYPQLVNPTNKAKELILTLAGL